MQRVLELVFWPAANLAPPRADAASKIRIPNTQAWVAGLAALEPLAGTRHDQAKFTTELHHCDDAPSGDPAWQCLVLDAGARRFSMAVHDVSVLPGVRVRAWEPVALGHDQLPDFAGQCGDVPWRADVERHWWRLDLDGEPLTVSLDAGVLSAPSVQEPESDDKAVRKARAFVELRISLELSDIDNPDDAAPSEHVATDDSTLVELASRAVRLLDLAAVLDADGAFVLVEHDALTDASRDIEPPRKAGPIDFGSRHTYAAIAAAVARNIFAQWMANAHGVTTHGSSEYVHQMRIALRRMRTAYRFFGEELEHAALVPEKGDLKWIGQLLGDVRDWDVLAEDTFPAIARAALGQEGRGEHWDAAAERVAAHRKQAAQALREAMQSPRYALLLIQVARQVAVLVARSTARRARPLNPDGRKSLRKRYKKLARAVDLKSLTPESRHRLRIDAKRLRYAIEFLAPALDGRQRRRMTANTSALQDALGLANDAIVGRRFLEGVDLDPSVRMFADGYLSATESHGVSSGMNEIDKIKKK